MPEIIPEPIKAKKLKSDQKIFKTIIACTIITVVVLGGLIVWKTRPAPFVLNPQNFDGFLTKVLTNKEMTAILLNKLVKEGIIKTQ